jgi:hypothetical protein
MAKVAPIADFVRTAGGSVDTAGITYADLTRDGVADAVVPIVSGEGGDFALFVAGYGPGGLTEFLRVNARSLSYRITAEGKLQVDQPQFAAGDPMCCPSQLGRTTYSWNGEKLVPESTQTVPSVSTP